MLFSRLSLICLLLSGTTVWSQVRAENEPLPRGEIYAGAVFAGDNPSNANNGFGIGADFRAWRWFGGQGEVDTFINANGTNTVTLVDYLFGVRTATRWRAHSRIDLFADLLAGGQTLNNSDSSQHSFYYGNGSGMAVASDAGVDVGLMRRLAVRGKGGFVFSNFAAGSSQIGNYRWQTAIDLVYRF